MCFLLKVKSEKLQDYLKAHDVWPEMLEAMTQAGIRNYSLFHRSDGLIVGYFESDNVEKSLQAIGQTEVNQRWQKYMAEYFESSGGDVNESSEMLKTVFLYGLIEKELYGRSAQRDIQPVRKGC